MNLLEQEKTKICIVEDSVTFADWLHSDLAVFNELEILGKADSVDKALPLIRLIQPDVVILDLYLNGGFGFDLLESIQEMKEIPAVFVLTNYHWPTIREKCHELGATGFFEKSNEYFDLIDSVRTYKKGA